MFLRFDKRGRVVGAIVAAIALLLVPKPVRADGIDQPGEGHLVGEANFMSSTANSLFLAAGTFLPLIEDKNGVQHSTRTVDSLLSATLITEGLKRFVRERRPDESDHDSFPSGHATAAFALATMQAHYHPRQSLLWYGGATLIAESRIQLNRHYLHDVVAGAAIGYFTARLELHSRHGLLLRPFINSGGDEASGAAALDGINRSAGWVGGTMGQAASGFAPYSASGSRGRTLGLSFSRAF